ncbi:type II secretion system protein J [Aestuariibius sp. 2305UL40-4]|uniref:PulJ/GspJ family protein n=1 Tax=Aestuariibius violaceus TaxID=3234132 RepID=UPI00345E9270
MIRRRRTARGFSLIEALVALSISAVTLSLMTGATWGLRQMTDRARPAEISTADDWIAARRVFRDWASAAGGTSLRSAGYFGGDARELRVLVPPRHDAPGFLGILTIRADGGGGWTLEARRARGASDIRFPAEEARSTRLLSGQGEARLSYLIPADFGGDARWRSEAQTGTGLPLAIALDVGGDRLLTARIPAERAPACIARLGRAGLEERECRLR